MAQDYTVLAEKSILRWTGKKPVKSHTGIIKLTEGSFSLKKEYRHDLFLDRAGRDPDQRDHEHQERLGLILEKKLRWH